MEKHTEDEWGAYTPDLGAARLLAFVVALLVALCAIGIMGGCATLKACGGVVKAVGSDMMAAVDAVAVAARKEVDDE